MRLGDFGTPKPALEDTFGYFGQEFRVSPGLTDLALIDFAEMAGSLDPENPQNSLIAMKNMLREVVHADDFDKVWALAKANGQGSEDIAKLVVALVEATTERPTERPATSSVGPLSTGGSSDLEVSSHATALLAGRPDLQMIVEDRQRSLQAV